jgi:hypothetical protein
MRLIPSQTLAQPTLSGHVTVHGQIRQNKIRNTAGTGAPEMPVFLRNPLLQKRRV